MSECRWSLRRSSSGGGSSSKATALASGADAEAGNMSGTCFSRGSRVRGGVDRRPKLKGLPPLASDVNIDNKLIGISFPGGLACLHREVSREDQTEARGRGSKGGRKQEKDAAIIIAQTVCVDQRNDSFLQIASRSCAITSISPAADHNHQVKNDLQHR